MGNESTNDNSLRIAVDMAPYVSDGSNGGVVQALMSTLKGLRKKGVDVTVITNVRNNEALGFLEEYGIKRFNVSSQVGGAVANNSPNETEVTEPEQTIATPFDSSLRVIKNLPLKRRVYLYARNIILLVLPYFIVLFLKRNWRRFQKLKLVIKQHKSFYTLKRKIKNLRKKADIVVGKDPFSKFLDDNIDILYCPFTAIPENSSEVPTISVVNDIQHKYMPFNFAPEELAARDDFYAGLVEKRPHILAISDYTRKTFIETFNYPEENIETLYLISQDRFGEFKDEEFAKALENLGLDKNKYIYFPANYWPHKNHRSLLVAYRMFKEKHPDTELKLVFSGALADAQSDIPFNEMLERMGLSDSVKHVGYVSDLEVGALMKYCRFLVYPSLFEGLGLPLVEAMAMNTTILCSNVTSLPEVAGKGAFYFNPHNPKDICETIERVLNNPDQENEKKKYYEKQMRMFSEESYLENLISIFERVRKREN